jgi:sialic acid synthase SpsE
MEKIQIGDRIITKGCSPFIIAEAGINHNGELEKAFAMINAAKEAGADAVKFQTFKAEEFITDPDLPYTYVSQGKEITESMLKMFKRYEFNREEWYLIKKRCDEEGIMFLSTPQNRSDLDLLLKIGIPAIKVGSDDFTNLPSLKSYSQTKLPMIVSCGMSDLAEVYRALEAVGSLDGYPTVLMLCTSQYPTPLQDVNLLKLRTLIDAFPMVLLGFSDHTQGNLASSLAVAFGAVVFEKHFTLSHNLPGPDHWFSEDPVGLKQWVNSIRDAFIMMGSADVRPTEAELSARTLARRSIVAIRDINKGDLLTDANVGLRRPGNGLPPEMLDKIIGLKATCRISKGSLLQFGDFK